MRNRHESTEDRPASLPVLMIGNDPASRERIGTVLEGSGYPVVCVDSKTDIFRLLSGSKVLGIVSGIRSVDGLDFHAWLSLHFPYLIERVMLFGSAASEKPPDKEGPAGWPFIQTPSQPKRFLPVIRKAMGEPTATERILLVDDEEPIREILAHMLGLCGYRCRAVAGGQQAIKLLDSGEHFDLVEAPRREQPPMAPRLDQSASLVVRPDQLRFRR
jgi:CheY-like chemotaxis protein